VERIWLKNYPPGIPAEIDPDKYRNIPEIFAHSVSRFASLPAWSNLGRTLRFAELDRLSRDFAAWLVAEAGLQPGQRVALMMPNLLQYPVALFGVLRAGLVVVNVNPLYTARELEHQLKDSGASAIVILENFADKLAAVIDRTAVETVVTTQVGDLAGFPKSALVNFVVKRVKRMVPPFSLPGRTTFPAVLRAGRRRPFTDASPAPEETAFLQYTGGTTGVAKGAELTHRNMVANMLQAGVWASAKMNEGEEVFIAALPLYHIFALTANLLYGLEIGAKNVLITNPRDFSGFVKTLAAERFTFMTGVNTLFNALLETPGFDDLDFSAFKVTLGGGMAVQQPGLSRGQAAQNGPLRQPLTRGVNQGPAFLADKRLDHNQTAAHTLFGHQEFRQEHFFAPVFFANCFHPPGNAVVYNLDWLSASLERNFDRFASSAGPQIKHCLHNLIHQLHYVAFPMPGVRAGLMTVLIDSPASLKSAIPSATRSRPKR